MTETIEPSYDIAISPSQIETFDLCKRKWAFQKIDRVPSTQNADAALGEEAHKHRENWLIHGIPPPDTKAGNLARVGMEHLPPPGKVQVEIPLRLHVNVDAARVLVNGRIDFFSPNTEYVFGERGVPLIGDHKTTSGEQWAKTADDLLAKDAQAAIYAGYALHVNPTAPAVDLHWSYMVKASSPRQHQVRARMTRDHAMGRFSSVVSRAKDMLQVLRTPGISASQVEPTVSACEAFGGCPYREICPISDGERIGALMAQGSLNDFLTARLNGAAAASATNVSNPDVLAGLLGGGAAAPAPAPAPAPAVPLAAAPAVPLAAAPAVPLAAAPAVPGTVTGLFAAPGTAPVAPVAPSGGITAGSRPLTPPTVAVVATPPLVLGAAPAPALHVAPPPVTAPAPTLYVAPAAQNVGIVPPDAPPSDPAMTLDEAKALETGVKKRGRPKKVEEASAVSTVGGDAMLAVLTRIAVALEALVAKG